MQILFLAVFFSIFSFVAILPAHAYIDEVKPSLEVFSGYHPMFFVVGAEHTKFQISFKAKFVENVPLYFGYQQTTLWDLFKASAPFVDTAYAPDIFYRLTLNPDRKTWLDFGALHESNGKDGSGSRAWNRLYVRYSDNPPLSPSHIQWNLQAWYFFTSHDVSDQLPRYRGIYELNVTWSDFLGSDFERDDLTLRLYPGGGSWVDPTQGGQELTLRLKSAARKFLPLFVFQVFHGYGESMLEFQDSTWVARAGIGF